jgi:hypothetical protein
MQTQHLTKLIENAIQHFGILVDDTLNIEPEPNTLYGRPDNEFGPVALLIRNPANNDSLRVYLKEVDGEVLYFIPSDAQSGKLQYWQLDEGDFWHHFYWANSMTRFKPGYGRPDHRAVPSSPEHLRQLRREI